MRPSPFRHTLAVLRTTIGLTQKEMAALVDCSTPTVQAIELGKLKMSERLGGLIALRTGVDLKWLLDDDVDAPAIANYGDPYTKAVFDQAQALTTQALPPAYRDLQAALVFRASLWRLAGLLIRAHRTKNTQLCAYKLSTALDELEAQFGVTEADRQSFPPAVADPRTGRTKNPEIAEQFFRTIIRETAATLDEIPKMEQIFFHLTKGGLMTRTPAKPSIPEPPSLKSKPTKSRSRRKSSTSRTR